MTTISAQPNSITEHDDTNVEGPGLDLLSNALGLDSTAFPEAQTDETSENVILNTSNGSIPDFDSDPAQTEELIEDFTIEVIDSIDEQLEDAETKETVGTQIDGETEASRSDREQVAIDETLDDVTEGDAFDIQVAVVRNGFHQRYVTEDGHTHWFRLEDGQSIQLIETANGERVLLVSADITPESLVDEVLRYVASEIEDAAVRNGVNVLTGFENKFISFLRRPVFGDVSEYVSLFYERILIIDAVELSLHQAAKELIEDDQNYLRLFHSQSD
ncbi:MAG: hypothetical protein AAGF53_02410 [Pseudomonadota bacterium]